MTLTHPEADIVERLEAASAKMSRVRDATSSVIFGQERVIDLTLITLLAGGHALLTAAWVGADQHVGVGERARSGNKRIQFKLI